MYCIFAFFPPLSTLSLPSHPPSTQDAVWKGLCCVTWASASAALLWGDPSGNPPEHCAHLYTVPCRSEALLLWSDYVHDTLESYLWLVWKYFCSILNPESIFYKLTQSTCVAQKFQVHNRKQVLCAEDILLNDRCILKCDWFIPYAKEEVVGFVCCIFFKPSHEMSGLRKVIFCYVYRNNV